MNINLTIDRFEENKAVLKTDDGVTVIWPKSKMPTGVKEGGLLSFTISSGGDEEEERRKVARDILNEILNVE